MVSIPEKDSEEGNPRKWSRRVEFIEVPCSRQLSRLFGRSHTLCAAAHWTASIASSYAVFLHSADVETETLSI